jgi:hypothetical protein
MIQDFSALKGWSVVARAPLNSIKPDPINTKFEKKTKKTIKKSRSPSTTKTGRDKGSRESSPTSATASSSIPSEFTLNNLHNLAITKLSDTYEYGPLSGFDPAAPWIERAERARKERLQLLKQAGESWDFEDKENKSGGPTSSAEKTDKKETFPTSKSGRSPFKIGLNLVFCVVALGVFYGPPARNRYHGSSVSRDRSFSVGLFSARQDHEQGLKEVVDWAMDEYFPYTGW